MEDRPVEGLRGNKNSKRRSEISMTGAGSVRHPASKRRHCWRRGCAKRSMAQLGARAGP